MPVLSVALAGCVLAVLAWGQIPRELAPTEDRGVFIIPATAPQGATANYTQHHAAKIEEILLPLLDDGEVRTGCCQLSVFAARSPMRSPSFG
jgi:multidrug efflux pump